MISPLELMFAGKVPIGPAPGASSVVTVSSLSRTKQLNQEMANLLRQHGNQVKRLAEVPGLGVDSAQQIIAEVGATVATFPLG